MQTFTYPFISRLIYRFGNILLTFFLLILFITSATNLNVSLLNLIPFIITSLLIYFLNKNYLMLYKLMPFKIEADAEKMICSDFIFSKKVLTICYSDVESLSGGVFDGKSYGLMKVCDGKNKVCVAFYNSLKNSRTLEKIILARVDRKVYDIAAEKIKGKKL